MSADKGHPVCETCWHQRYGDGQGNFLWPIKQPDLGAARLCCWCGDPTWTGIFVEQFDDEMAYCEENHYDVLLASRYTPQTDQ